MTSNSDTYTRSQLKVLKAENDRLLYEREVDHLVHQLKSAIINTATTSEKTYYFRSLNINRDESNSHYNYKIIKDCISRLKEIFIDLKIEFQEHNQGIYIDWN
jgi:hypothetical protein